MQYSIIDSTDVLNNIACPERDLALLLIDRFFILEESTTSEKINHYPLDDQASSPEEKAVKLELMNKVIWDTVLSKMGTIDFAKNQKVGKIIHCKPNKFHLINDRTNSLKPYLFEYPNGELQAEINFTIELI